MKTSLAVVLLVFAGGLFAQKQSTPPGTPGQIKDELIRIEHEIGRANLECDFHYFFLSGLRRKNLSLPTPQAMFQTNGKTWPEKRIAGNPTLNTTSMTQMYAFILSPPSSQAA